MFHVKHWQPQDAQCWAHRGSARIAGPAYTEKPAKERRRGSALHRSVLHMKRRQEQDAQCWVHRGSTRMAGPVYMEKPAKDRGGGSALQHQVLHVKRRQARDAPFTLREPRDVRPAGTRGIYLRTDRTSCRITPGLWPRASHRRANPLEGGAPRQSGRGGVGYSLSASRLGPDGRV